MVFNPILNFEIVTCGTQLFEKRNWARRNKKRDREDGRGGCRAENNNNKETRDDDANKCSGWLKKEKLQKTGF